MSSQRKDKTIADQAREWRDDARANIERYDNARGLTAGQAAINALLRPREVRILMLCEALLDLYDGSSAAIHRASLIVQEKES